MAATADLTSGTQPNPSAAKPTNRILDHLSDELVCSLFQRGNNVLRGRETCRKLRRLLLACGSVEKPLYMRVLIRDDAPLAKFMEMAAFMNSFSHVVVLVVSHLYGTKFEAKLSFDYNKLIGCG